MKNNKKNKKSRIKYVKYSFSGNKLTQYSGLNIMAKFFKKQSIGDDIENLFPTVWYNSTKSGIGQVLMSIILASLSGINRISKISNFTKDALVQTILNLETGIDENLISGKLKKLGEAGTRKFQTYSLKRNSEFLEQSKASEITLDTDSTAFITYGNQEGAAKGYNTVKKGAKGYNPLILFVSELKLLYHSWFRTGSTYTSNGITHFIKEVKASLQQNIKKVFFRADSGFFSGKLLDLLEKFCWDYLIKVKLKNLQKLLEKQQWQILNNDKDVEICEFEYQAETWKEKRKLKGRRTVKEYVEKDFFGKKEKVPVYEYSCYVSSYDKNADELHELYKKRSTSETWIEQVKSQLMAGKTLTDNFWANDLLWQLATFAYNTSIMMRRKKKKFHKQEHSTFKDWFINLPGKVVFSGRSVEVKMYKDYYYKDDWLEMARIITET